MSTSSTDWEDQMKKAAEKGRINPTEDQWDRIRQRLENKRTRRSRIRWITWLSAAAGFALLIAFTALYVFPRLDNDSARSSSWERLPERKTKPMIVPHTVYAQSGTEKEYPVFRLYRPDTPPHPTQ